MNKIKVVNNDLTTRLDDSIKVSYQDESVLIPSLTINILDKTELFLDLSFNNQKINIDLNIDQDLDLVILCSSKELKIKYNYNIDNQAKCSVIKYNQGNHINEMVNIELNDELSEINYTFKSISTNIENYDYVIHHNSSKTISNIINNGVNIDEKMNIQISGYVPNDIKGCICNQSNRIINLTNNKCEIRPNLYIDCDDVDANHSALIGKFTDEEMFYLNSRGINDIDAIKLLIKGFLLSGIDNDKLKETISEDIDKYWR